MRDTDNEKPTTISYEDLKPIANADALHHIAQTIYFRVSSECNSPSRVKGATPEERVMLAVHTVLDTLENGYNDLPAFNLVPTQSLYATRPPEPIRVYTDADTSAHEYVRYKDPVVLADSRADGDATLTGAFEDMYTSMKDRFETAARDLFGTPYILARNGDND